ncbi:Importin 9, partial [Tyrophagus putrescentiae]
MATNGSPSLKEAVAENLLCSLSADRAVRGRGEQALTMLEAANEGELNITASLCSKSASPRKFLDLDFSVRHLAAVLLDGYISRHWAEGDSKYTGPPVSDQVRPLLRHHLLSSLTITSVSGAGEDNSTMISSQTKRLLSSYAHSVSKIAAVDWPAAWPELFPVLAGYLVSKENASAVFSSLAVFSELAHEITDMQVPSVAPVLLPAMLDIFTGIFVTLAETVFLMAEYQRSAIKQYLEPHIARYAEAVIAGLEAPETGPQASPEVDVALKAELLVGVSKLLKSCSLVGGAGKRLLKPRVVNMKRSIGGPPRVKVGFDFYANPSSETGGENADPEDHSSFDAYLYALLNFIQDLFESSGKYRTLVRPVLTDLLHLLLQLMEVTSEQEQAWLIDTEQFLEDDDLDSAGYSVRLSAQDLLMALAKELAVSGKGATSNSTTQLPKKKLEDDRLFKVAFVAVLKRHFSSCRRLPVLERKTWPRSSSRFWTPSSGRAWPPASRPRFSPDALCGRPLASVPIMNDASLEGFLAMTAGMLASTSKETLEQGVLKVHALRATYYFCEHVSVNSKVHVIRPHLTRFLQGLVSLSSPTTSPETLYLILQTIATLLRLDHSFTASVATPISHLAASTFLDHHDDPTVFDAALDLVDELLKASTEVVGVYASVVEALLPTIVAVLKVRASWEKPSAPIPYKSPAGALKMQVLSKATALSMQPEAVDLLSHLLRTAPGPEVPLLEPLINGAFPVLMSALAAASPEDSGLLQSGSEAVRWYVAKGAEQLAGRVFEIGGAGTPPTNGLVLAVNFCHHLLSPALSAQASAVVLITRAQPLLGPEPVQQLLQATLVKLAVAQELLLVQSLVLVFAHLFYGEDISTMLAWLHSMPAPEVVASAQGDAGGPKMASALAFLLDRWLAIQHFFIGYENKAAVVALCRLFTYSLEEGGGSSSSGGDELGQKLNLHRIEVTTEGDDGGEEYSGAVRTRSKQQQQKSEASKSQLKKTLVPATVKMLKLLLREYVHILELK